MLGFRDRFLFSLWVVFTVYSAKSSRTHKLRCINQANLVPLIGFLRFRLLILLLFIFSFGKTNHKSIRSWLHSSGKNRCWKSGFAHAMMNLARVQCFLFNVNFDVRSWFPEFLDVEERQLHNSRRGSWFQSYSSAKISRGSREQEASIRCQGGLLLPLAPNTT